jgi:hypothetical protein
LARGSSRLFLNLDPNAVAASVEERCPEQPNTLATIAEALCAQVEMPFGAGEPEFIPGCRGVGWRGVDSSNRCRRIAVLERLKRMDAGSQRRPEAHRVELHRNGAVQLERPYRISKATTRSLLNRPTYWRKESVEATAGR